MLGNHRRRFHHAATVAFIIGLYTPARDAFAQASPFQTGANSLVNEFQIIAIPLAILMVMVLAGFAFAGRLSAGVGIGALLGICLLFGAPQLVDWTRGLFGL